MSEPTRDEQIEDLAAINARNPRKEPSDLESRRADFDKRIALRMTPSVANKILKDLFN